MLMLTRGPPERSGPVGYSVLWDRKTRDRNAI
jgi:hypothetical protein